MTSSFTPPGILCLRRCNSSRRSAKHKGKVTAFVPLYAMSGGTLIALAADEIVMCEHSVLGPIDPQLGELPAVSLIKVVEDKPVSKIDDPALILADVGPQGYRAGHASCERASDPSHVRAAAKRRPNNSHPVLERMTIRYGRRRRARPVDQH